MVWGNERNRATAAGTYTQKPSTRFSVFVMVTHMNSTLQMNKYHYIIYIYRTMGRTPTEQNAHTMSRGMDDPNG